MEYPNCVYHSDLEKFGISGILINHAALGFLLTKMRLIDQYDRQYFREFFREGERNLLKRFLKSSRDAKYIAKNGSKTNINPNMFFDTKWYKWHHLGNLYTKHDAFLHYYLHGRVEMRSPSPYIDIVKYDRSYRGAVAKENYIFSMINGSHSISTGVYLNSDDLKSTQNKFVNDLKMPKIQIKSNIKEKKNIVILQESKENIHESWMGGQSRDWDLAIVYYDELPEIVISNPEYTLLIPGSTKTSSLNYIIRNTDIIKNYEYLMLLDNDVIPNFEEIDEIFKVCKHHKLDIAQASLSKSSAVNYEYLRNKLSSGLRYLNAVEIMMPILSRESVECISPYLKRSVSGWGIDLLLGKVMRSSSRKNAAIIDDFVWHHKKEVDTESGEYYEFLRGKSIYPMAEYWDIHKKYGTELSILEL